MQYTKHSADNAGTLGVWFDDKLSEVYATNDFTLSEVTVVFIPILQSSYLINSPKVKAGAEKVHLGYSSHPFMSFTGAIFINDCLLQPMLHVSHPLLQFADITDALLSTAALFFRFYNYGIQTWAIKAASIFCQMNSEVSHAIYHLNRQQF